MRELTISKGYRKLSPHNSLARDREESYLRLRGKWLYDLFKPGSKVEVRQQGNNLIITPKNHENN